MATKRKQPFTPKQYFQRIARDRLKRFRVVMILGALLFLAVVGKLAHIQVFKADFYQQEAKKLRSQSVVLYNRGRILDRKGVVLSQDVILYDLYAHPRYYYEHTPSDIAKKIAPLLKQPVTRIQAKLERPNDTIRLANNLDKATVGKIKALHLSGLDAPKKVVRRYPQGRLASHVLGYVNDDASVSTGIEYSGRDTLRKPPELPNMEVSGKGDYLDVHTLNPNMITHVPHAEDVQITIDARIQFVAEQALAEGLKKAKAERGTVVVMNPRNGEILAFSVLPDFHPEQYHKTPQSKLKNWAITDVFPPGSTFKILTVASGLETGVINEHSHLHDTGVVKMQGYTIQNYDYGRHGAPGDIDLVYLFQHSSNVGSLLVSLMMDKTEHYKLLKDFGIGEKTNIDLPGESAGILHNPAQWDQLTHGSLGFGYGLAVTGIQMAAAVSAIANDGVWVTPHLIKNQNNLSKRRVISESTARMVTKLLAKSIANQPHSSVRIPGLEIAGKTGTSRKPNPNGKGYSSDLFTSFIGYFPADDPEVLVMVTVDSPKVGNAWGSTIAGPIFREVALQTASYLGLKLDTMGDTP